VGKMFANGNHTAIGVSIGWSGATVLPGEAVPLPIPRLISPYLPPFPRYNRRASVTGFFPMQTDLKISDSAVGRVNELLATKDSAAIERGSAEVATPLLEPNVRGK